MGKKNSKIRGVEDIGRRERETGVKRDTGNICDR